MARSKEREREREEKGKGIVEGADCNKELLEIKGKQDERQSLMIYIYLWEKMSNKLSEG